MPPKCAMDLDCQVIDENQRAMRKLFWVDIAREITRNLIGLVMVPGIVYLLYKFVEMAQPDEKMQVMLLVIGYLGGLATGICTWYFGGAMRSAVQQALSQTQQRGGISNVQDSPETPAEPPEPSVRSAPAAAPLNGKPVVDTGVRRISIDNPKQSGDPTQPVG
jgi:hypothetical protein